MTNEKEKTRKTAFFLKSENGLIVRLATETLDPKQTMTKWQNLKSEFEPRFKILIDVI